MSLILATLENLKSAVLPPALQDNGDWDDQLLAIGSGVAAAMQRDCNRLFERIVDDTFERSADCSYISLPRFPIETVSTLEVKYDEAGGWTAQPANTIFSINQASGIVEFGTRIGTWTGRVRVTYTGGYWPADTPDKPDAASDVPEDLLHAWHIQVQHEVEALGLFTGQSAAADASEKKLASVTLIPRVREMIRPFIRYA